MQSALLNISIYDAGNAVCHCRDMMVGYDPLNSPIHLRRMTHFQRASCPYYFGTIKYFSLIYRSRTECFLCAYIQHRRIIRIDVVCY